VALQQVAIAQVVVVRRQAGVVSEEIQGCHRVSGGAHLCVVGDVRDQRGDPRVRVLQGLPSARVDARGVADQCLLDRRFADSPVGSGH
jgi:hypothetical protein